MKVLKENPARDEDGDGIHYGQTVINYMGYWVTFMFTIILIWMMASISFQMVYPPQNGEQNYLSEFISLIGYVVSALVGSITTLLAVFGGSKAKSMMEATTAQRKADMAIVKDNRESVYEQHVAEMEAIGELEEEKRSRIGDIE